LLSQARLLPFLVLLLVAPHQLPVDVGNLLQAFFHPVIILNPLADLLDLIARHRATGPMRLVQGHAQIPDRTVTLTARTLAIRIAAGQVAFHQGTAKHFAEWRQKFG